MPSPWKTRPPANDAEYFERMSKAIFTAGLNWSVVEKKWLGFHKAFLGFSPGKVGKFSEKTVRELLKNECIVRNEKKIRATIYNANQILTLEKVHGSFRGYLESFKKDEQGLQMDLQKRFKHLGPSTARMFLWSVAYPLTPNAEEKKWMSSHRSG